MPLLKPGQSAFSSNPAPQLQALQSAVKPPAPVLPKPTYSAAPQQSYQAPQNMQPPQNYSNDFNTAGSIGSKDVVAPPAPPSATSNSDALMKTYLDSLKPSDYQSTLQDQSYDLQNQYNKSQLNQGQGNALIEDQAIPLNFQTGREANLAKQYELQRQGIQNNQLTVQQKLANEQAKRQSAIDVTKAMVDYSQKQQELSKPVFGGYGASGYQINPATGKYEPIDSPSGDGDKLLADAQARGLLDPSQITRYGRQSMIDTLQQNPNFDFKNSKQDLNNYTTYTKDAFGNIVPVSHFPGSTGNTSAGGSTGGAPSAGAGGGTTNFPKADAASLQKQQEYADSTQRAFNTANANLQALIPYMQKAGVNNTSTVPLINSLQNRVKAGYADPGTIAAYHAALAGLRAEYAQVLSRGGEVTEGQRSQANSLIPDDLTPTQLTQVAQRLNIEGTNAVNEAQAQIKTIKDRVNGVSTPTSSSNSNSNPLGI